MTPDFALSLTSDGLTLLRRKAGGWLVLADADLSADGFDAMRERALAEDASGAQVALFLPNDQVRYLELTDPGADPARRGALEAALDGATPYPVEDLVLDWSLSGTTLLGAAVARESLEEAEAFLRDRGFDPVYFAAIPPSGTFRGTAFFGPSEGWQGAMPDRPGKVILLPEVPEEEPVAAEPDAQPEPVLEPEVLPEPVLEPEGLPETVAGPKAPPALAEPEAQPDAEVPPAEAVEPSPVAEAAPVADETPAEPATEPEPEPAPRPAPIAPEAAPPAQASLALDAPPAAPDASPEPLALPEPEPPAAPEPHLFPEAPPPVPQAPSVSAPTTRPAAPSFTSVRASRDHVPAAPEAAPRLTMGRDTPAAARPVPTPVPVTAPVAIDGAARPAPDMAPQAEQPGDAEPSKRRGFGFGKRRGTAEAAESAPRPTFAPVKTPPEPETGSATTQGIKQVTPRPPVSHPLDPAVSAPVSGRARVDALRREAGQADAIARAHRAAASLTPAEERERLTVFGARGEQKVGGKPRFLGLILTLILLLFLAAVAAFASVFLGDEISRLFTPSQTEETALAAPADVTEPATDTAEAPDVSDEEDADSALAEMDLPPPASEGLEDAPAPRVTERNQMTSDEAAETYAVTGIWQRAPNAPARPPQTSAEDVYVASIDPEVQQFDAVALPDLDAGPREDLSLEPMRLPPGPGVRFDLDARGLVKATPEGTVSPDGVRIFTGLPPQVPPLRDPAPETATPPADEARPTEEATPAPDAPGATEPEAATVETAPETAAPAADPALSGVRPRGRPGDLIEQTERAVLGGVSLAELEKMRPQMRPLTAQEEAMALDLPVTEQAISASLTPLPRPRSMEDIVKEAVKQASNAPAPVAIAPGPNIPQNASVSKSATLTNQIDLREVSLIGVYGKDSSRRALVRLPSGKYQKVQVGDSIDGGRVAAIDEDELRYVKGGRNVVLKMPRS